MASGAYNRFKLGLLQADYGDMEGAGTYKAMLVGTGYTFDPDDSTVDDVSGEEINGTGYDDGFAGTGRQELTTKSATQDDTNDRAIYKFDDLAWTGLDAGTYRYVVLMYEPAGATADTDCLLITCHDLGARATDGSDETITINATDGAIEVL